MIASECFSLSSTSNFVNRNLVLSVRSLSFSCPADLPRFAGFNDFRLHNDFNSTSNDGFQLKKIETE